MGFQTPDQERDGILRGVDCDRTRGGLEIAAPPCPKALLSSSHFFSSKHRLRLIIRRKRFAGLLWPRRRDRVDAEKDTISDVALAESLDLSLAFRYSDYETFGGDSNYKVGLNWQIVPSFKIRANVSTAFRVPNVNELFGGVAEGNLTTTDPCSGWDLLDPSDIVYQNCQADGVPMGFMQLGNTILTTVGGNQALLPESADTITFGVVFEPSFLEGLSITLDYFDIEIDDAITQIPGSTKLDVCYNTPGRIPRSCAATWLPWPRTATTCWSPTLAPPPSWMPPNRSRAPGSTTWSGRGASARSQAGRPALALSPDGTWPCRKPGEKGGSFGLSASWQAVNA